MTNDLSIDRYWLEADPIPPRELHDTLMYALDARRALQWLRREIDEVDETETMSRRHLHWMGLVNNDTRAVKIDLGGKMAAAVLAGEETHILNAIRERCVREGTIRQMWDFDAQGRISELHKTATASLVGPGNVTYLADGRLQEHGVQPENVIALKDETVNGVVTTTQIELSTSARAGLATILGTIHKTGPTKDALNREWPVLRTETSSLDHHSSGGGRERLNRWRTRITIWHLAYCATDEQAEADQKRKDAARSLADYGARVEHDDSGKIVKIVLGDEVVWSPERDDVETMVHDAIQGVSVSVTGWHAPEEGQLKPNRLRIALDSYLMTTVEATLSGNGIDGDAELLDSRNPHKLMFWSARAGDKSDRRAQEALNWLARIART